MFTSFARPSLFRSAARAVPVLVGMKYAQALRRPVFCDAIAVSAPQQPYSASSLDAKAATPSLRKLDYGDLCIGSVTGLFLGIIIGKLSSAIVFLSVSGYLLLQFLENRGIISIPWTSVLKIGDRRWDLKSLFFNHASFKLSFVASFLIAAFNV